MLMLVSRHRQCVSTMKGLCVLSKPTSLCNIGNKEAKGDVVVWMDDSDYYPRKYVGSLVDALVKADVAGCKNMFIYDLRWDFLVLLGAPQTVQMIQKLLQSPNKVERIRERLMQSSTLTTWDDTANAWLSLHESNSS